VGSLLAKSVGVVAPFAMLLSDHAAGGWQRVRCAWRAYAAFGLLGIAYLLYVRSFAVHALFEAPVRPPHGHAVMDPGEGTRLLPATHRDPGAP
jgi:hypothetical protein